MLRMRRYRVFLLFAVLTLIGFYHFGSRTSSSVDYLKEHLSLHKNAAAQGKQQPTGQEVLKGSSIAADNNNAVPERLVPPPAKHPLDKPVQHAPPPSKPEAKGTGGRQNQASKEKGAAGEKKPVKDGELADKKEPMKETGAGKDKAIPKGSLTEDQSGRVRVMPNPIPADSMEKLQPLLEQGEGRWESDQLPLDVPIVYWERPEKEHFPIAEQDVIHLPTGTPKKMPKIQADFGEESIEAKKARLEKQKIIKEAFLHAWNGYKEKAWGMDEIMPLSGGWKNPFNGWGATLVDSLDLIWMMGLEEEFEEAVEAVGKINFKTSRRADVPIFETTIRYLGGLLGAYDVSGGKYKVLLEKAVELGDIMLGSFDTPNRMPDTFYQWKPTFMSQPHRASTRVVLAELGSLAVEFTRLSQLTKEPRYYDAIARITDALEEWQGRTLLPGMWPSHVDASGCQRVMLQTLTEETVLDSDVTALDEAGNKIEKLKKPASKGTVETLPEAKSGAEDGTPFIPEPGSTSGEPDQFEPLVKPAPIVFKEKDGTLRKRQLNDPGAKAAAEKGPDSGLSASIPAQIPSRKHDDGPPTIASKLDEDECLPQGLQSQSKLGTDEFTLGSLADSTYEYLPKMYLMLNGLEGKYRVMYEKAINAAKEHLIFRAMIPNEKREILVSGTYHVTPPSHDREGVKSTLSYSGSHLTCFAGGMFAMGAKLFGRKEDMDIAAKLTDGCVYAYEMTATGIMPETFTAVACEDRKNCAWNQTKWWEELDPNPDWREKNYETQVKYYNYQVRARESAINAAKASKSAKLAAEKTAEPEVKKDTLKSGSDLEKRQLRTESIARIDERYGDGNFMDDEEKADVEENLPEKITSNKKNQKKPATADDEEDKIAKAEEEDKEPIPAPTTTTPTDLEEEAAWSPPPTETEEFELPSIYSPEPPPAHEEYVKKIIQEDRLPPGIKNIMDRRYILRPEALESVFYMHRLSGSPYWRQKGWSMIQSILTHTRTPLAHAAIDDVTKEFPQQMDSMESFWLAETLKYAWLLFEEEGTWSLDEWVFNTEAHLLRREGMEKGGG